MRSNYFKFRDPFSVPDSPPFSLSLSPAENHVYVLQGNISFYTQYIMVHTSLFYVSEEVNSRILQKEATVDQNVLSR